MLHRCDAKRENPVKDFSVEEGISLGGIENKHFLSVLLLARLARLAGEGLEGQKRSEDREDFFPFPLGVQSISRYFATRV